MPPKAFQAVSQMRPRALKWSPRSLPSKPKGPHRVTTWRTIVANCTTHPGPNGFARNMRKSVGAWMGWYALLPSRPQRICKKYAQIRWTRRLAFRRGSLSLPAKPQRICKTCAQIRWTRQGRTNPSKPQRIWKKYVQIRVQLTVQLTVTPDPAFFA